MDNSTNFENMAVNLCCNPLEIPCILNEILYYLPYEDLGRSRLVSKHFNEEATRILRKRTKIVLNCAKRLISFNLEMSSLGENRFCEYFQLINVHITSPAMIMFFERFGEYIKSFDLRDSKFSSSQLKELLTKVLVNLEELVIHGGLPKEKKLFEEKLPNVKSLDLQLYDKTADEEVLSQFARDMLKSCYNLEVVRSRENGKWKNRREKFQRILFEELIKKDMVLGKLRKIGFSVIPWNDEQILQLAGKKFPLEYLNLTVLPDISTNCLIKLLISLKNSLKKLKLSFTSWRIMEFPDDMDLRNVHHLSLDWFNGSLNFVSGMKCLRTLILAQADINKLFIDEAAASMSPQGGLATFEIYQSINPIVLPNTVKNMSKTFPNLKALVIGKLSDESMRQVFSSYPLLEEFSAIEGTFTDFGVVGIDQKLCEICTKEHLPEICKGDWYDKELVTNRRKHAFVADLTQLRKLTLKSPSITNLSVIHGVSLCNQGLKHLSLWSSEMNFRSLKCIVDTFQLDYLESTHTFSHSVEIRYCLEAMYGRHLILNGITAPTTAEITSLEAHNFVSLFHDNVCRSIISQMKHRSCPPYDHDLTIYHNKRHEYSWLTTEYSNSRLVYMYEACMADPHAWQDIISNIQL